MKIKAFIKLIRVNNWIKNLIVFLPIFFAGEILNTNTPTIVSLILTFVGFSLISSSIYILNDLIDLEKDRLHPEKCKRPIASNIFSKQEAIIIFFVLLIIGSVVLLQLKQIVALFIIAYFILNILYCFFIKKISIIDVGSISLGFVFRVLAGGFAAEVTVTHWIIIMIFLLMFSVGIAKRRDDLVLNRNGKDIFRASQKGYNLQFIDMVTVLSFSITLMAYIMYSVSGDVIQRMGSKYVYITALPVFLGILRYLQLSIVKEKTGSPVKLFLSDIFLISIILIWLIMFSIIIYV